MKVVDLKVDMIVETLMCVGRIASDVKNVKTRWQRARVTAIVKRKSQFHPHGHVKIDVLKWFGGGVEVSDEIGLHELDKYLRLPIKYVAVEPPPMDPIPDPFATVRDAVATMWLDDIVRELGGVRISPMRLPEGDGFEASIDVPELGDYATGYGLSARAAALEAAKNARNKDVRK